MIAFNAFESNLFKVRIEMSGMKIREKHKHNTHGAVLRDLILGGQDGLVNVLGIVLGVATATNDAKMVLVAGLVATFAESISMAAVAYTSTNAEKAYYDSLVEQEKKEMKEIPHEEVDEVKEIYHNMGFRGKVLDQIVKKITSKKDLWLKVMLSQELGLQTREPANPIKAGIMVGIAAFAGSIIPLMPFFFMPVESAFWWALIIGVGVLFAAGAYKAKVTVGSWWKSGLEIAIVGTTAAVVGYLVGAWLSVNLLFVG